MTSNFTFLDLLHSPISPKLLVLPYPDPYLEPESHGYSCIVTWTFLLSSTTSLVTVLGQLGKVGHSLPGSWSVWGGFLGRLFLKYSVLLVFLALGYIMGHVCAPMFVAQLTLLFSCCTFLGVRFIKDFIPLHFPFALDFLLGLSPFFGFEGCCGFTMAGGSTPFCIIWNWSYQRQGHLESRVFASSASTKVLTSFWGGCNKVTANDWGSNQVAQLAGCWKKCCTKIM